MALQGKTRMKKILFCVGATVLFSIGTARAADPPDVKEGLWSSQTQTIDNPGNKRNGGAVTICRSHAYDQYVKDLAAKMPGCKKLSEDHSGRTYTTVLRCTVGNTVIDTKETATFKGDTAIHSETHATYSPPLYGVSESTMIMDQEYLGSCPAGSQPGDMKGADGKIINTWKH
jgi:Protein of unknown function (DUF3617)